MIEAAPYTVEEVIAGISGGEPLVFSRWGDGEWSAILGHGSQNCDGQSYTEDLRETLRGVLRQRPRYRLGIQSLALRRFGEEIEAWLASNGLRFEWVDSGVFHGASISDRLTPLIEALERRSVVLVGPQRLAGLPFSVAAHVVVPDRDAYSALGRLYAECSAAMHELGAEPVVAVSAGMGAKVLIHWLSREFSDRTILDFGSVWEPYVGVANRTYHHKILERLAS